jgi:hypothetical protein
MRKDECSLLAMCWLYGECSSESIECKMMDVAEFSLHHHTTSMGSGLYFWCSAW